MCYVLDAGSSSLPRYLVDGLTRDINCVCYMFGKGYFMDS